ncbi:MAG: hypothetical protein GWP10_00780 [Nitrospiraceae bacterium]|nr:hypothetical protein [Nitrospiraceae bacterium]
MTIRHRGREIALQILYQYEWDAIEDIDRAIEEYAQHLAQEILPCPLAGPG